MTAQAVRTEQTVGRVLEAAEGLFLSRAYSDVTMDDIASEAGVTKGALYHHFESKETLYVAMMTADLAAKRALFSEAAAAARGCREKLRALTASFFEMPRAKRDLIQLVRRDANFFRGALRSRLVRAYQEALPEAVEEIVREGLHAGELRRADARVLAWSYIALVEVTLTPYGDKAFPDGDARLDHVLDLFFQGAGA